MIGTRLWVGLSIDGNREILVFDPEIQLSEEGLVLLFIESQLRVEKFESVSLRKKIKSITKTADGQAAIKKYITWKNSEDGKNFLSNLIQISSTTASSEFDNISIENTNISGIFFCHCPICCGNPSDDLLFDYLFGH